MEHHYEGNSFDKEYNKQMNLEAAWDEELARLNENRMRYRNFVKEKSREVSRKSYDSSER